MGPLQPPSADPQKVQTDQLWSLEPAAGKRGRVRVRGAVVPWCRGEPHRNIQLTSPKHGVQQPVRRAQIRSRRGK